MLCNIIQSKYTETDKEQAAIKSNGIGINL